MRKVRRGGVSSRDVTLLVVLSALMNLALGPPAGAGMQYGPVQLSGDVETQSLVRHSSPDEFQFVQNRNTVRLRLDYDWLKNGQFLGRFNVPFLKQSRLFLLYRGVYDGFYDIAPADRQHGQERLDDIVGGPVAGNDMGSLEAGKLKPGLYSRLSGEQRRALAWENRLREAYVDLDLAQLPLSFRLGRQQVIWGESDQFRLTDIWNPLDLTWHYQQESWDNIRIPLWLGKALWQIGQLGPLSSSFVEVVYNPFDFQPNAKLDFLPRPWAVPVPNPLRDGQVQQLGSAYFATQFDLQGTSLQRGDFHRNPQDASEVGVRFHAATPQGVEFSANYLYARGRGVGANVPFGVDIQEVRLLNEQVGKFTFDNGSSPVVVKRSLIKAKVHFPYNHIFGFTLNYFDSDYTAAVLRMETAYVTGEPYQTVEPSKLNGSVFLGRVRLALPPPQDLDKRDSWAGMVGFDRPTWIRPLNARATWFLSGQFFWSYISGNVSFLRGTSGTADPPYFTPAPGSPGSRSQGIGQWTTGPYAGIYERLQDASANPSGDDIHRWEHLLTLSATSFYRGGTVVPFLASAWDPVDDCGLTFWSLDYFYTNEFIITLSQRFYYTYGSRAPVNDPWFLGRAARRDETGIKLTYQF